jgi:hypothetical protein
VSVLQKVERLSSHIDHILRPEEGSLTTLQEKEKIEGGKNPDGVALFARAVFSCKKQLLWYLVFDFPQKK